MITKKYILFLIFLFIITVVGAQNSFEFHGKISIDGVSPKIVKIVVTKNGSPYKTFHPESNGKYSFNLDYNSVYIVSYVRKGYVNKKVEVNTIVPDKVLKDNKFKYKWKTDVNLFKKYEGIDFSFFDEPIQKIFFNNSTRRFIYDDKYAKQIEKELREKMAEVERRKAEELKKAEEERKRLLKERQQAIRDSLAQVKELQKQKEKEYKQQQLERQKQIRDSLQRAKVLSQQQKAQEAKNREEARKQKIEEARKKREDAIKQQQQERAERLKQIKEAEAKRKADKEQRLKEFAAEKERRRQQLLEMNKKDIVVENTVAQNRKIKKVTVTKNGIVYNYRKVVWKWGGVYYFKNDRSIGRSTFYLETKK